MLVGERREMEASWRGREVARAAPLEVGEKPGGQVGTDEGEGIWRGSRAGLLTGLGFLDPYVGRGLPLDDLKKW